MRHPARMSTPHSRPSTPVSAPAVDWNPAQYAKFRGERAQPFYDLLALVDPRPAMRVVDLGCGPGELTRVLHETLHARETLGLDNSPAMLAQAAAYAGDSVRFAAGDLGTFAEPGAYDLIFANASLQWSPDHPALLARLTASLAPGGQLAVQVPANDHAPSHATAAIVAGESPFREALGGHVRVSPVLAPEAYATLLHQLGYAEQTVRLQVYGHLLPGREDVIEWVRGTTLTDYQKRLSPELWAAFLARYRELLLPQLAATRPFFYPFNRILFWARRPA